MNKRATIHDIARIAGVSSATVSRVLSNSGYPVSTKLRNKIRSVSEELQYVPNQIGKQLKTNRNMTIGVVIPSIRNPFYSAVTLGIEDAARQSGYQVLLCNSHRDGTLEDAYLQTLFEKQVKGIILSSISGTRSVLTRLIRMGLLIVAMEQELDMADVLQIGFDYRRGGFLAASHLLESGHRKIGYVSAPLNRPSRRQIYRGFVEAMQKHGMKPDELRVEIASEEKELFDGLYEFENGKALTRRMLSAPDRPTAIFACNDLTAFGVMNELVSQGIRVPDEMSVMGFDNIDFSSMVTPALTTIRQPDYEMGRLACMMLLDKLNHKLVANAGMMLQPELMIRNSVRRIPG